MALPTVHTYKDATVQANREGGGGLPKTRFRSTLGRKNFELKFFMDRDDDRVVGDEAWLKGVTVNLIQTCKQQGGRQWINVPSSPASCNPYCSLLTTSLV